MEGKELGVDGKLRNLKLRESREAKELVMEGKLTN
jgi:hypothetical protein